MKYQLILLLFICLASCSDSESEMPETKINNSILLGQGVGDITFNSSGNDIKAIYGDPEDITIVNRRFVMWYYDIGLGFLLDFEYEGEETLNELVALRFDLIDYTSNTTNIVILTAFDGATPDGIKIGTMREEVISKLGEPLDIGSLYESYETPTIYVWYNSSNKVDRIDLFKE